MPYVPTFPVPADLPDTRYLIDQLSEAEYAAQEVTEYLDEALSVVGLPGNATELLTALRGQADAVRAALASTYEWHAPARTS